MKQIVIKFGLLAIAIAALLKLMQYSLFLSNLRQELIVSFTAIGFVLIGIYLSRHFRKQKNVTIEPDVSEALKHGITKRELEVLTQMSKGQSNSEIAESLFISESTVKTHVSNLLSKLNAKRRTEALRKAREHNIITHS